MAMCFDPGGVIMKKASRYVGSNTQIPEAAQPSETPEVVDPDRDCQAPASEAGQTAIDVKTLEGELP
jgi:hypothetical protein